MISNVINFYKEETEEKFTKAENILKIHGFTEEKAEAFLEELYCAVAREYGE